MGLGDWFKGLFGDRDAAPEGGSDDEPAQRAEARWLEPDDPDNPFEVRLLDLMENTSMISVTRDPAVAARAVSWSADEMAAVAIDVVGTTVPCALSYPAPLELAEGFLYRPAAMEDKWVIVYRGGHVAAARSWTGETKAVARARHDGHSLELTEVTFTDSSGFDTFGEPVATFDWLIRTHALGERIPLPVSNEGARLLAAQPLVGFSPYGRQLFCAAVDYVPDAPTGRLHSDGALIAAVSCGDAEAVAAALQAGEPVNAPCRFSDGATALHLAIYLHPELVDDLLRAGADVNLATLRGSTPLMACAAAGASSSLVERLIEAGADVATTDTKGFSAAHVAAQFGSVAMLDVLMARGADFSARTEDGLTPIHVAAAMSQPEAIRRLVSLGLDPTTASPLGDPATIAESEGHPEVARLLRDLA